MKSIFKLSFLLILSIILISCAQNKGGAIYSQQPSQEEMISWNWGKYPSNYKKIVESELNKNAPKGKKIYYEYEGKPEKIWIPNKLGVGYVYGYGGCVVQSSNDIGRVKYRYIIRDGRVVVLEEMKDSMTLF